MEKALSTRARYMSLPGFIGHPEGFSIKHHIINAKSAKSIWVADLSFDDFFDQNIEVGIFESEEAAHKYVKYYMSLSGEDTKQGYFTFDKFELDKSFWDDGFVTV